MVFGVEEFKLMHVFATTCTTGHGLVTDQFKNHQVLVCHKMVAALTGYLPQIPESKATLADGCKATWAQGIDSRQVLALIDPSDLLVGLHIAWSPHPRLP